MLWEVKQEDIARGYSEEEDAFKCVICETCFEKGEIFLMQGHYYDAERAAQAHLKDKHGSMLDYILELNNSYTGLTPMQTRIISYMASGMTDKAIAAELNVASSTVRNHRYKLREKEKQAKVFLALMTLLSETTQAPIQKMTNDKLIDNHVTATMIDDRYDVTDKEREKILNSYFTEMGALKQFPAKEKRKIIVLRQLIKQFKSGTEYSEREVNQILKRIFDDYVTLRRALIEYGFLERTYDGSKYWIK